jgi:FkbM family methyltransferase
MTFISYAQNFEDVMLWRALKHVATGFYVDLGAWSPDLDSVTRAFYDRGWCGINVEPSPEFHEQLNKRRPRDINLKVAVGAAEGFLTMNFLTNPGLSTLDDAIAEQHKAAGLAITRDQVQVKPLARLWHEYVPAGQEVHFLKVDVEGFEEPALKGNDWSRYRPWIVVVEATSPMSQMESYHSWEPILLGARYQLAYADGLNRFYVAEEHVDLLPALIYPPNVFDGFLMARQQEAESRATEAEARATEAEARATEAESRIVMMHRELTQLEQDLEATRKELHDVHQSNHHHWLQWEATKQELEAVHQSNHNHWQLAEARQNALSAVHRSLSWRITAPFRFVAGLFINPGVTLRKALNHAVHRTVDVCQRPLSRLMSAVLLRPQLAYRINQFLMRYPALYQQLLGVARRQGVVPGSPNYTPPGTAPHQQVPAALEHLTPRARQIYADLKAAIENNKRRN